MGSYVARPIREVYPDYEDGQYGPSDYQPMLESWGYPIILQLSDDDYQGDSYLLLIDGWPTRKYGILVFGWGSCSGCDALQDCDSFAEIEELRTQLHDSIRWGTQAELYEYVTTHDWEGDFSYYRKAGRAFVAAVTVLLGPESEW